MTGFRKDKKCHCRFWTCTVGGAMKKSSLISDKTMQAIVARCDIMFLSHNHPDHIDPCCRKDVYRYGKTGDCSEQ